MRSLFVGLCLPLAAASSLAASVGRAVLPLLRPSVRWLPFAALFAIYVVLGHVDYLPDSRIPPRHGPFRRGDPYATSGDEPHYMLVINSLLFDRDVRLDADYARVHAGGSDAGQAFRGVRWLGGHSLLVDPATGRNVKCSSACRHEDYAALAAPQPDLVFQVPAHPLAYPILMAALALPFRAPSPVEAEVLVGRFSILIAFGGVVLAYACARRGGLSSRNAALCAVLLGLASPWLVYLRAYYSESSIGLFLALGFLALQLGRPFLAGLGAGVAMAMKPVFLLVALAWIAERLWARRPREAIALAGSSGLCAIALLAVNMAVLHTPLVGGAGPIFWSTDPWSLIDPLLEPTHGLFLFAPWTIVPFAWAPFALRRSDSDGEGRLSVEARRQIVLPSLACAAAFGSLGFGPGLCYGPRYFVPLLPLLALLAVDFAFAKGSTWRVLSLAALGLASLAIALSSVPQYHQLFSQPPLASLW